MNDHDYSCDFIIYYTFIPSTLPFICYVACIIYDCFPWCLLIDPQIKAGEDGLGAEMEHGVHLARHREAALLAAARLAAYRYRVL